MKIRKLSLVLTLISFIWFSLLLISPFLAEPNSITNLDGKANSIDYQDKWNNLSLIPRIVYTIGDLNCHQKHYRTYYLNGNEMPVCARDLGIFSGFFFGFLASLFIQPTADAFKTAVSLFPKNISERIVERRFERKFILILCLLFVLPMLVDGLLQTLLNYESTNINRYTTGSLFGFAFAIGFYSVVISWMCYLRIPKSSDK